MVGRSPCCLRAGAVAAEVRKGTDIGPEPDVVGQLADSACDCTLTGSVTKKVEPCPSRDSIQILPPCISTIRFDMARPSPVPSFLRVIGLSICWNSWNNLA